jgi:hypothetical protein
MIVRVSYMIRYRSGCFWNHKLPKLLEARRKLQIGTCWTIPVSQILLFGITVPLVIPPFLGPHSNLTQQFDSTHKLLALC